MAPEPAPTATLDAFPMVISLPVQWGDQDALGHVNNTIYLRWFESARIAYLEKVGFFESLTRARIGPILASITCDYRRPIVYPETVRVGARITRIGRTSLTMEHRLIAESAGAVAAEGSSVLVVFDYQDERPHPVPEELRRRIEALEGPRA